jgi:hypothetical protein
MSEATLFLGELTFLASERSKLVLQNFHFRRFKRGIGYCISLYLKIIYSVIAGERRSIKK